MCVQRVIQKFVYVLFLLSIFFFFIVHNLFEKVKAVLHIYIKLELKKSLACIYRNL